MNTDQTNPFDTFFLPEYTSKKRVAARPSKPNSTPKSVEIPTPEPAKPKIVLDTFNINVAKGNSFNTHRLSWHTGVVKGSMFLNMTVTSGQLQCCGMGTISGFSSYSLSLGMIQKYPGLRMPPAEEIRKYMHQLLSDSWFYPEALGVVGPGQRAQQNISLFEALFDWEVIHESTNKNYAADRTPMLIVKVRRKRVYQMWQETTEGATRYNAWLEANGFQLTKE